MFFVEAVFFWLVRDLRQEEGPLADNVLEQGWTEGAASRREVGRLVRLLSAISQESTVPPRNSYPQEDRDARGGVG
jgi:hypothetical protein